LANHLVDTILSKGNRQAHNLKVAGSNPAPAPNLIPRSRKVTGDFAFECPQPASNGVRKASRNTIQNPSPPILIEGARSDHSNPLPDREMPLCLLEPLPRRQDIDNPAIAPNRYLLARLPVRLERFRDAKPNSQVDSSRKIVVGL